MLKWPNKEEVEEQKTKNLAHTAKVIYSEVQKPFYYKKLKFCKIKNIINDISCQHRSADIWVCKMIILILKIYNYDDSIEITL